MHNLCSYKITCIWLAADLGIIALETLHKANFNNGSKFETITTDDEILSLKLSS